MSDDDRHSVRLKRPVLTGFLVGIGAALALVVVGMVAIAITVSLGKRAMERATAEAMAAEQATEKAEAAEHTRAERIIAEERANQADRRRAQVKLDAIAGLVVEFATIADGRLSMAIRNESLFPIKAARLSGVVLYAGKELDRGEFDVTFDRRILEDQTADVELPAKVLWKSMGDSITNDVEVTVQVVDVEFGEQ